MGWPDAASQAADSILLRLGRGISSSTDKLCPGRSCEGAVRAAASQPLGLVPINVSTGCAPD